MSRLPAALSQKIIVLSVLLLASPAAAVPIPAIEYLFNEGVGTTAINTGSLGVAQNGSINGGSYSIDTPNASPFSLDLSGDLNNVKIPDFGYGGQLTVEAWIKPNQVDNQRVIFDDYGNPGVLMAVVNGQLEWGISTTADPGPGVALFVGTVTADLWQHVAGTYDGSLLRAYVNGVLVGSVATSGAIIDGVSDQPTIGSDDVSSLLDYDGRLDDFRIFPVALACEELAGGAFANACQRVPEPGTAFLLVAGIAGFLALRRRRTAERHSRAHRIRPR